MDTEHILIAGGGLAGATAAKTLRSEGFQGRITVVCAENEQPYLRPPLSKEFLLGKAGEDTVPVLAAGWYGRTTSNSSLARRSRLPILPPTRCICDQEPGFRSASS
ncbi:biphenyl dioxygenase system ferredoxin--NAD(+) reductase component [Arthrobacter sp. Hiyo8]|nr:biphenyl dioxygenase system ferredoxin--NAD(+) reductase component [Arthrobacter sp. Hiyo8]